MAANILTSFLKYHKFNSTLPTLIIVGLFKNISAGKSLRKTSCMNLQHLLVDFNIFKESLINVTVFKSDDFKCTQGYKKMIMPSLADLKILKNNSH